MTDEPTEEFNPNAHTMNLQGKAYLPVAARVAWFRSLFPCGSIQTQEVEVKLDAQFQKGGTTYYGYARFKATVFDELGHLLGQGTKTETAAGFFDYVEKAETGAIGRALAAAGFGTPDDAELDEGDVVDAPRATVGQGRPQSPAGAPQQGTGRGQAMYGKYPASKGGVWRKLKDDGWTEMDADGKPCPDRRFWTLVRSLGLATRYSTWTAAECGRFMEAMDAAQGERTEEPGQTLPMDDIGDIVDPFADQ